MARPIDHDLPFSTWSLSKLAEFLVAEGVVDDISHEGPRVLLRDEGKVSNDPDYEAKWSHDDHRHPGWNKNPLARPEAHQMAITAIRDLARAELRPEKLQNYEADEELPGAAGPATSPTRPSRSQLPRKRT